MKQKSTKLLPLAAIALLLVALAGSCRKTESPPVANNHFDAKAAQDWWWGSFRKTAAYKQPNLQSPFTGFLLQSRQVAGLSSYIFKHPQFKLATAYTIGQMQVVEVPLLYPINVITIPGAEHQTPEQNKQIAGASLQRALFFKTAGGNIEVRLATIIPAYGYAARKGFDISHNNFAKLDKDFSGFIFIRQWDETPVRMVAIENGRTTKTLTLEKSNPTQRDLILQCGWEMVQKEIHTCIMAADGEYENPPDASDCINWQTSYVYDLEWVCHDESYELGGVDCSILDGSAYADCVCSYFGICDGGGKDEEQPDCMQFTQDCENAAAMTVSTVSTHMAASPTIKDTTVKWIVAEHDLGTWRIVANTHLIYKGYYVNGIYHTNIMTLQTLNSSFEGSNSFIETTWIEKSKTDNILINNSPNAQCKSTVVGDIKQKCKNVPHPACLWLKSVENVTNAFEPQF